MIPNTLLFISTLYLVGSKLMSVNKKAVRNADLNNIYKTDNQLWEARQCSRTCCITSCLRHKYCSSFAYNSITQQCQVFNRDFKGQSVSTYAISEGIVHYDLVNEVCELLGPFGNSQSKDCADLQSQGYSSSGVYTIVIGGTQKRVWCDLQTDGGRWTVIQHRKDGSVNFSVGWHEYKDGFGVPCQEYWLGNDALYGLTNSGAVELLILMEEWDGDWVHARYSSFRINDESDKYRLSISGYTGTAGDSLRSVNNHQFSTRDQDNDAWAGNACNPYYHAGGWWYGWCAWSDLNGLYYESSIVATNSCNWYHIFNDRRSLKTVLMMIRKY